MVEINIREFAHNMSKYLKKAKNGERIVLMERNKPIIELKPVNKITKPGWKRNIKPIKLKSGISLSEECVRMRREDKW